VKSNPEPSARSAPYEPKPPPAFVRAHRPPAEVLPPPPSDAAAAASPRRPAPLAVFLSVARTAESPVAEGGGGPAAEALSARPARDDAPSSPSSRMSVPRQGAPALPVISARVAAVMPRPAAPCSRRQQCRHESLRPVSAFNARSARFRAACCSRCAFNGGYSPSSVARQPAACLAPYREEDKEPQARL